MTAKYAMWFRRDLRLQDNMALFQLIEEIKETDIQWFGFFHLNPYFDDDFDHRYDYYFQTLVHFLEDCSDKGIPLQIVTGDVSEAMKKVSKHADSIYFNRDETGYGAWRDKEAADALSSSETELVSFLDAHLHHSGEVKKKDGGTYKVFTPYYRAWKKLDKQVPVSVNTKTLARHYSPMPAIDGEGETAIPDIRDKFKAEWQGKGETAARRRLTAFVQHHLQNYDEDRDKPAVDGTSRLSRYLKTGAIGIRTVYDKVMETPEGPGRETFIQELAWRDFYNMIYAENPNQANEEIQEAYRSVSWSRDEELFKTWTEGKTGFPIVDAAMRQLSQTGWMHNRLRMITASFLTKDYLLDWRLGERYFAKKLVDYDPASNIGGWQWAASVGTDAVPYFRVFNPVTQSKRFDPDGEFIRKYIPELKNVPDKYIHEPWKMKNSDQQAAGCLIGEDYPKPSVDHKTQRKKAIAIYEEAKDQS